MISRRDILRKTALGFGSIALTSVLEEQAVAEKPLEPKIPHFVPRAKRVIFLFMKGGPSQVDTFEYKPQLQRDDGKELPFAKPKVTFAPTGHLLASPWKFAQHGQCGHYVSELFPQVAKHVDDICFLHGLHGTNPAHGGASLKLHTGADNFVRPSMGAWISYGLGTENANLPAFVTICPTLAHGGVNNWGGAFLPADYAGTPISNASVPAKNARMHHITNPQWTLAEQRVQLDFLKQLNRDRVGNTANSDLESRIHSFELAFRMQTSMPEIQEIGDESGTTHKLYGLDNPVTEDFGRQCLLARRFCERGVRFVQVTHSDGKVQWDQHGDLRHGHAEKASEVDQPIAGLLEDLKIRGLLNDTLVMWSGEFGRTPTVEGSDNNGRDHNPWGFTMWLAGGGVKGGTSHGATDEYGFYAQQGKVHIHDFHATLLYLLGIDHKNLTYRHAGRDFRLTDVFGNVVHDILS